MHFCLILTDLSDLLFLFHQKLPLLSYVKNVLTKQFPEAVVRKFSSEAVAQRCSVKKMLLEISQNSQENTRARVSLLLKLQAPDSACNFIKRPTLAQVFSCEFCEISKNTFSYRTLLVAASSSSKEVFLKISRHSQKNICVKVRFLYS